MSSYKSIAKTTGLVGVSQFVIIIFKLIQGKVIALLLGSFGVGLLGLYTSFLNLGVNLFSLGVNQSGVRQIAKVKVNGDKQKIYKSTYILKVVSLIMGALGSVFVIVFSKQISIYIFDNDKYKLGVIIASFFIFFEIISRGQQAVINGLRHINDLVICRVISSVLGCIVSILYIYFLGVDGIPYSIVSFAFIAFAVSRYYLVKYGLKNVLSNKRQTITELKELLGLGFSFCIVGIITYLFEVLNKLYISDKLGVEYVGLYQASFSIANVYIGMILSSMGVDFMPRLVSYLSDKKKLIKCINEQIELGIVISGFIVLIILIYAPIILNVLYSVEFQASSSILRWQVLGVALRIIAFPFGYLITSMGKGILFSVLQFMFYGLNYVFLTLFIQLMGGNGLGINYFIAYGIYLVISFLIVKKLILFSFSSFILEVSLLNIVFIGLSLLLIWLTNGYYTYLGGIPIVLLNMYLSYKILKNKMDIDVVMMIKNKIL